MSAGASSSMNDAVSAPHAASAASAVASLSSIGSFQLTPLYGCDSSTGGALCSILRVDDCTILLDLGWDERFDEEAIAALKGVVGEVDAVLITHPDVAHLGALPYAVGKLGLNAPVYCTLPVWRNGQMFMYDAYQALALADTPPFTLDDVDKAFDQMRQLKYSETVKLKERGEGIEITPSCAGHMLGGAFWFIKKENESIIYAVDFNHAAERHLNGALLNAPQLHRPSALITDATNVLVTSVKRSVQDATLTTTIADRLRMGGNVLMPVDAAGRVLELLLVIHGLWASQQLHTTYTLAFLSSQSGNTVDFARSQLEWMTDKCRKMFDTQKVNPFAFPYLKLISSTAEIADLRQPYCLLASNAALETSLSQEAFYAIASDPRALLLLTTRAPAWSIAGSFFDPTAPNALKRVQPREVTFTRRRKIRLEGRELEKFVEERKMEREQTAFETEKDTVEDVDEDEDMGDLGKPDIRRQKVQQVFPLFPFSEPKRTFDIWGETLTAEEVRVITGATATAAQAAPQYAKFDKQAQQKRAHHQATGNSMEDVGALDAEEDEPPQKTIREVITLPVMCQVAYIDLEGRSDGRAIKTVIKDVQPRKLIVLGGSASAKENLRAYCVDQAVCKDVVLPSVSQTISVTSESNLYRVNLKESLLQQLHFVQVNDEYEVAFVEGEVRLNYEKASLPTLQPAGDHQGHAAVFLGQVRPAELQLILQNDGIECELVGGVLVCRNGLINVHRVSDHQISIQGALCDEYYRVRDLLYQQYQIV